MAEGKRQHHTWNLLAGPKSEAPEGLEASGAPCGEDFTTCARFVYPVASERNDHQESQWEGKERRGTHHFFTTAASLWHSGTGTALNCLLHSFSPQRVLSSETWTSNLLSISWPNFASKRSGLGLVAATEIPDAAADGAPCRRGAGRCPWSLSGGLFQGTVGRVDNDRVS